MSGFWTRSCRQCVPAKGAGVPCRTAWGAASGGAEGVRTPDPRLAKPMLSQLSYSPVRAFGNWWAWTELNCRPHAYQACALTT